MEKNKISLLKDFEEVTKEMFGKKKQKNIDERVFKETNEIMSKGLTILITIIYIMSLILRIFDINISINIWYIMTFLGIIEYILLIVFCKKCLIKYNEMSNPIFIGGILILPLTIVNHVVTEMIPPLYAAILILSVVLLYMIANIIYKKAMEREEQK